MNAKPFLVITYHLLFVVISMGLVATIEGYGTEMFAGAFYFNLIYLFIGGLLNYLSYIILQRILFYKQNKLLIVHFLTCLLLMNVLSFFLNSSLITWVLIKGIFVDKGDSFYVAIIIHALMLFCYLFAFLITRRRMQTSRLWRKGVGKV